ncbi:hypothetical protein AN191_00020 [Loktanella sp. 5RATIMAR09]|uniref:hypothetical protein n=1 Tax=Loktanella sp. 5RATIMAR09 TaxID=1225655 RepID=UPI0006EBA276|nr:hypothetical protein [Loktanella sp. 5RATIMAR09]KQI73335.1 hypothetical protein AN191_00020 [Loktanella sp. 5RATIMAR09]
MMRFTVSLVALATLSACAATTVAPTAPTVSARDVDNAMFEAERIAVLPLTPLSDLPSGGVTYRGHVGADVTGDAQGSILGDMTMLVDFGDNDISGNVTNINLIDPDGTPNQRFGGSLGITGTETRGDLDAFASGQISGVNNDGFAVDSQMVLTLDGTVRDNFREGDAVFGSATGFATGDFNMDVNGVFFGTAN